MQADQREMRHVMIESQLFRPALLVMTTSALLAQLARMYVIRPVTVLAGRAGIFLIQFAAVAGTAEQFTMPAKQREFRLCVMIEHHGVPAAGTVTGVTTLTMAPPVHIIIAMTRNTISGKFMAKRSVAMAGVAGDLTMFPGQRIIGALVVIEADAFPAFLAMAVGTGCAVTPCMHIVETVTGIAPASLVLILLIGMAAIAGYPGMLPMQGKICLVMVKVLPVPALFCMAVVTLLAKVSPVHIICFMTGKTALFGTAVLFTCRMACHAVRSGMRTLQCVIRLIVIKRLPAELDDIRIAALVILMATAAFLPADLAASVEAFSFLHVAGHILVAIQAQRILAALAERAMAATAFALVFRMALDELSGHYQRFDSGRMHIVTIYQDQHRH